MKQPKKGVMRRRRARQGKPRPMTAKDAMRLHDTAGGCGARDDPHSGCDGTGEVELRNPIKLVIGAIAAREALRLNTRLLLTRPPIPGTIDAAAHELTVRMRDLWLGVADGCLKQKTPPE